MEVAVNVSAHKIWGQQFKMFSVFVSDFNSYEVIIDPNWNLMTKQCDVWSLNKLQISLQLLL